MRETTNEAATEAARACLYAVVDRFNTEDSFWGSFVPEFESSRIESNSFSATLRGRGVRLEVQGTMLADVGAVGVTPNLVVGAVPLFSAGSPIRWHAVTCTVDPQGRFETSNFRNAIEAAIEDIKLSTYRAG